MGEAAPANRRTRGYEPDQAGAYTGEAGHRWSIGQAVRGGMKMAFLLLALFAVAPLGLGGTTAAAAGDGGEKLVVVSTVLEGTAGAAPQVPGLVSVGGNILLGPLSALPPELEDPALGGYVTFSEQLRATTASAAGSLRSLNDALSPLGPTVNPLAEPAGAAVVAAAAATVESGGDLAGTTGHRNSFVPWFAGVVRAEGDALGF